MTTEAAQRILWLDLARGTCMVLVVLLHADFASEKVHEQTVVLHLLNMALVPLRMPLFFLVSGLLACRMLRKPPRVVLVRRVLFYLYLYALWWVLQRNFAMSLADFGPSALMASFEVPGGIVSFLGAELTKLWFLYALALFYLTAMALRRLQPGLHMAAVLAMALPGILGLGEAAGWPILDRFCHYPYFALGLTREREVQQAAAWLGARFVRPLACAAAWLLATVLVNRAGLLTDNIAVAGLSVLALPAGLGGSVWLAASALRWARPLIAVGRNTLTIYVLHPMVLHGLILLVPLPRAMAVAAWVILVTMATVLLAQLVGRVFDRVPGLFRLPGLPAVAKSRLPA